jgi:hypothetical protein
MATFNDNVLRRMLDCISEASHQELSYVDHDVQDEFNSVLILCDYLGTPTESDLDAISMDVKRALDPWVPKFDASPSWTINIYYKRTLIHCIVGDGVW